MSQPFLARVLAYYDSIESRIGYRLFLGGTRHFGYYESENSSAWQIDVSLRRMEAQLLSALACEKDDRVLDAGCGVGHVAMFMARKGGLYIDAIDVTPHHVVKAIKNVETASLSKQISVREVDYHDLSVFEDDTFDGLYTMETFVHAREPLQVLQEFYRVLKPGGRIAMNEYDHQRPDAKNQKFIKHITLLNDLVGMPGFQSFETDDIKKLLIAAGFEEVKQKDLSRHIAPMLWLFRLFAFIPYILIKILHLQWLFPNTCSGALGYKYRHCWRYLELSARKPLK